LVKIKAYGKKTGGKSGFAEKLTTTRCFLMAIPNMWEI
jgi:hypothetical protein